MLLWAGVILIVGILVLGIIYAMQKFFRLTRGNIIYSDSEKKPGELLHATSVALVGKPDFLIKKNGYIIPVELKRGKTPESAYPNHVAQLYAYCLLVREKFGVRPPYGILQYPEKELRLEYPEGSEEKMRDMVRMLVKMKEEPFSRNAVSKICRNCRLGKHNI